MFLVNTHIKNTYEKQNSYKIIYKCKLYLKNAYLNKNYFYRFKFITNKPYFYQASNILLKYTQLIQNNKIFEIKGFEPLFSISKTDVLPLDYISNFLHKK